MLLELTVLECRAVNCLLLTNNRSCARGACFTKGGAERCSPPLLPRQALAWRLLFPVRPPAGADYPFGSQASYSGSVVSASSLANSALGIVALDLA